MALTASTATADDAPAPAASTPLPTRPAKKLELAPQNESTPLGYKLLAGAVVVAGAIVYVKKKQKGVTKDTKRRSSIDILARSSIGVRNELLVVDVEGTRLLVGMTPGSMSTLAVLQTPEGVVGEESPFMGEEKYMADDEPAVKLPARSAPTLRQQVDAEDEVEELEGQVRSLLEARKNKARTAALPAPTPPPKKKTQPMSQSARVPGQAKGLLLSMQDADVTKLGDW
jgi:flagellar biogenesis protein FliO